MWQENLLQNLLTITILVTIFLVAYLKISGKTFSDIIQSIKSLGAGNE